MAIGEDLNLDVPRPIQVFLEVHRPVAKGGAGFGGGLLQCGREPVPPVDPPHPLAASSGGRFEEDGVPHFQSRPICLVRIAHRVRSARNNGHSGGEHPSTGFRLVAHRSDGRGRRADKY